MAEQSISSEVEKPLLDKMCEVVARGERLLESQTIPNRRGALILRQFYILLFKLYGENSSLLGPFREPLAPAMMSDVRDVLRVYLPRFKSIIGALEAAPTQGERQKDGRIFIGHGRSMIWRELKDFLEGRLGLLWDEFNRDPVAGYATSERLGIMLDNAVFAFLIMTAEDEHTGDGLHARQNVVHEIGLFQGRLGMHRAIILLEEGCAEFSNIFGLSQIRFPRGHLRACFEEVRLVLEREGLILR